MVIIVNFLKFTIIQIIESVYYYGSTLLMVIIVRFFKFTIIQITILLIGKNPFHKMTLDLFPPSHNCCKSLKNRHILGNANILE